MVVRPLSLHHELWFLGRAGRLGSHVASATWEGFSDRRQGNRRPVGTRGHLNIEDLFGYRGAEAKQTRFVNVFCPSGMIDSYSLRGSHGELPKVSLLGNLHCLLKIILLTMMLIGDSSLIWTSTAFVSGPHTPATLIQ
jgi:hypothetical protein